MGCRLELNPDHIFECFFEVEAPSDDNPEPKIVNRFPADYKDEVVDKELPKFCFPYDLGRYNPAGQFFTFVLIGLDNKQRFGFCRHPPGAGTCLCILSHLPWFEICYKMLNSLAEFKHQNQLTAGRKLLTQLYSLPVPNAGQLLRLTVSEKGAKTEPIDPESTKKATNEVSYWMREDELKEFSFACPDPRALPRIPENRNITEFFSAVDASNMMLIFVSLLYERRVLITSEKLSRLTACVHGAASLLFPLYWQHIYIPVMPSHLIDYCCAPMPFLVGVHASFMPKIRSNPIDEVVILNADTNEIENPFNDIETLPSDLVRQLKNNLKNTAQLSGDGVARAFLKFLVRLIGGYKHSLKLREGEEIVFDKESFVESRSSHMSDCLEKLLQMQHFTQFIDHRVDKMNEGEFVDDAFEEEINNAGDLSSKNWKTAMQRLKDSTASDGKRLLLHTVRGMRSVALEVKKTAQETINDVNSEAMKHYFQQTKDFAKDGVSEIKKKMGKGKEAEDSLDTKSLGSVHSLNIPPMTLSSSAPASPNSSPQFERKAFNKIAVRQRNIPNGQSKYQSVKQGEPIPPRRRSDAMDSNDDTLRHKRTSASEKSKCYKEINFDETGKDNDGRDDLKPSVTDIDLISDVNEALANMGIKGVDNEEDDVVPLPQPPRRRNRNSSKSIEMVAPALPPPPVAPPRRKRNPQGVPASSRDGRKNNNNSRSSENLIDIDGGGATSLDHLLKGASKGPDAETNSPVASHQSLSNFADNVPTSPTTASLLQDYGLNFDIPNQQATSRQSQAGHLTPRGATSHRPFSSVSTSHQQTVITRSSSVSSKPPVKMRLNNPSYEQTFLQPAPKPTKAQTRLANPSYEHTFLPSVPQVTTTHAPQQRFASGSMSSSSPFRGVSSGSSASNLGKGLQTSGGTAASDPFADLVSLQRNSFEKDAGT